MAVYPFVTPTDQGGIFYGPPSGLLIDKATGKIVRAWRYNNRGALGVIPYPSYSAAAHDCVNLGDIEEEGYQALALQAHTLVFTLRPEGWEITL